MHIIYLGAGRLRRGARALALVGGAAALAACAAPPASAPRAPLALRLSTDKAAYAPRDTIHIKLAFDQADAARLAGRLRLTVTHLDQTVASGELPLALAPDASATLDWTAPAADFQGYGVEVALVDAGNAVIASASGAIDVSSSWLRFPRYGYVAQFGPGVDSKAVIEQLSAYHINALQFYDWQWKHHLPVKGDPADPAASWPDIAGRTSSRRTVEQLIAGAHGAGMAAMSYNLIYGAADGYAADGVDARWGLYDSKGGPAWSLEMPAGWATPRLYLFNPADRGWQRYLFEREMDMFRAFDFDGWHADTVGDHGIKYDAAGNPVDIKETFKPFLNAAKERLGKKILIMNTVSNKGHLNVHTSKVDAVYTELWPEDGFPDYRSVKDAIEQARGESGGKSLIVPAYINYDFGTTRTDAAPGLFNDPGVLLTEATVLAAGGSRLELGDDTRMLCHAYFPSRALVMGEALKQRLLGYYDFAVAYENLLRDGQAGTARQVAIDGVAVSADGVKDTVWSFTREDARHEIVHLINLVGVADVSWRDTNATQRKPAVLRGFRLKYYTGAKLAGAYLASPDAEGGRSRSLPMESGTDARGAYVAVTVPSLEYWDVIYFNKSS